MARSRRKPAASVDFSDREQARVWFRVQHWDVCITLAMRSALRVLPWIAAVRDNQNFAPSIALPVLRACFVTWAIAKYPFRRDHLRIAAQVAARTVATARAAAAVHDASSPTYYFSRAAAAASDAATAPATAPAASASRTAAAIDVAAADLAADTTTDATSPNREAYAITGAIRVDAVAIEHGSAVAEIAAAPLWPGEIPERIVDAWDRLRTWMLEDKTNSWNLWVQWYERVRDGRPSFGEVFDLAVASLTDEQWNEEPRPAAVNRRIAALLAEHTGQVARPEAEKAAQEAEPQTAPDPPASDARQSPKPNRRGNSGRIRRTAQTTIGKALLERSEQVQLALVAVISLIDEKLHQLNASPPNSDEARREWTSEISELEKLRRIVEGLQADVTEYLAGAKAEKETVRSVKSFAEGVEDYWTKNHAKILQAGFNAVQTGVSVGLFVTAMVACTAMGAGGTITTALCGALVGGKPAIEALKAVVGRGSEAIRRVSTRRSRSNSRPRV